jgi:hypothetical protein
MTPTIFASLSVMTSLLMIWTLAWINKVHTQDDFDFRITFSLTAWILPFIGVMSAITGTYSEIGWPFFYEQLYFAGFALAAFLPVWTVLHFRLVTKTVALVLAPFSWMSNRYQVWQERDAAILRRFREQAVFLQSLIPETEWADFREEISRIAKDSVPLLLDDRSELRRQISSVGNIIARYKDQPLDSTTRALLTKTAEDKVVLHQELAATEEQLEYCRAFFDHIESDFYVARRNPKAYKELERKFHRLSGSIQQTHDHMVEARAEVNELAERRKLSEFQKRFHD